MLNGIERARKLTNEHPIPLWSHGTMDASCVFDQDALFSGAKGFGAFWEKHYNYQFKIVEANNRRGWDKQVVTKWNVISVYLFGLSGCFYFTLRLTKAKE